MLINGGLHMKKHIRGLTSFLLVFAFVTAMFCYGGNVVYAHYEFGNCGGNVSWSYDTDSCVLTISGRGSMLDCAYVYDEDTGFGFLRHSCSPFRLCRDRPPQRGDRDRPPRRGQDRLPRRILRLLPGHLPGRLPRHPPGPPNQAPGARAFWAG